MRTYLLQFRSHVQINRDIAQILRVYFVYASRLRFPVLYSFISRSRYELYTKCWHTESVMSRVNA